MIDGVLALLIGLGFGVFLQKGRFCFVSAFRDFFAYKDSRVLRGVIGGIVAMSLGVSVAYFLGTPSEHFWVPNFGLSNLIGGFVFGVGMTVAGGCASGTLYRAAQGYLHYWLVLVFTVVGYVVFAELFAPVFLPYFFSPLQVFEGATVFLVIPRETAPLVALGVAALVFFGYRVVYRRNAIPSNSSLPPEGPKLQATLISLPVSTRTASSSLLSAGALGSIRGSWNTTVCGIAIGLLGAVWFALWSTWSVTGPEVRWVGLLIANVVSSTYVQGHVYWGGVVFANHGLAISLDMIMLGSLMLGAFLASLLSGDFRFRKPSSRRLPNIVFGGLLMGFGARLAPGCNISNAFGGLAILSVSSGIATLGLILGVYLATHWMFRQVGCAL